MPNLFGKLKRIFLEGTLKVLDVWNKFTEARSNIGEQCQRNGIDANEYEVLGLFVDKHRKHSHSGLIHRSTRNVLNNLKHEVSTRILWWRVPLYRKSFGHGHTAVQYRIPDHHNRASDAFAFLKRRHQPI